MNEASSEIAQTIDLTPPKDSLSSETEEIILNVSHGDDTITSGKLQGEFPYLIVADGASEVDYMGKYYGGLGKQASEEAVREIQKLVERHFKNGLVTDEAALIKTLESAFQQSDNLAARRRASFVAADERGDKPPLNTHLGATTGVFAMLWGPDGAKKWYVIGVGNGFVYRVPRAQNRKETDFIRDENRKTRRKSYNADDFIGKTTQQPHVQIVDYDEGDSLVVATDGLAPLILSLTRRDIDPRGFLRDRIERKDWKTACDPVQNPDIRVSPTAGAWHYGDDTTVGVIRTE